MKLKDVRLIPPAGSVIRGRVLIIYTGGTFGMTRDSHGVLVPFDFALIMEHLPILRNLSLDLTVISFENPIDSSNIEPDHWIKITEIIESNYSDYDGFVVLHGTDTMAFTASALSFMLQGLSKPVIFTGAQLPISEPRSDARENLITALEIASAKINGLPAVPEVSIFFDFELLRGNRSKKVESMQFNAFDSGNYPPLANAGVRIDFNSSAIQPFVATQQLKVHKRIDTAVSILKFFPGISKETVEAIVHTKGLKALVLETYGSGNAPTQPWLTESIKGAIHRGILVINISQCAGGRVIQGKYETSKQLEEIGVISGADMTTEAAVTKLMVLLGSYDVSKVRELIQVPVAGEMTL